MNNKDNPDKDPYFSFNKHSAGFSSRKAAGFFFEVLQLKTWDVVELHQEKSYGDISITPGLHFDDTIDSWDIRGRSNDVHIENDHHTGSSRRSSSSSYGELANDDHFDHDDDDDDDDDDDYDDAFPNGGVGSLPVDGDHANDDNDCKRC
jgi:hypothetical protein